MVIALFYHNSPFPDPSISVRTTIDPGQNPVAESAFHVTCTVTGAERLTDSTITYKWFKNTEVVSGQTTETLFFPFVSLSDIGGYECQATLMSSLLSEPIITYSSHGVILHFICKSLECVEFYLLSEWH